MKNYVLIGLIGLLTLSSACNYEDDNTNENPEKEIVALYNFKITVNSPLGNLVKGATVNLYDSKGTILFTKTTNEKGEVAFADLKEGATYSYDITLDDVTTSGTVTPIDSDLSETVQLEIEEEAVLAQRSPIVISGLCSDPRGSDGAAAGTTSSYDGGTIVIPHDGGYEYIQLLALVDIDFSVTPHSIVTCSNSSVGANGWAEGGARTLKFNLDSGTVTKGSFFYVGGMSKVISGYGSCGKSTDISASNWIRTIDYKTDGGDDFGDPVGGLLGNVASDGSNTPDGVAVFQGLSVLESTVPLDAVFYGTEVGGAYDAENNWGYRVPESNDHYSNTDVETGEVQPFFGQGSNTYLFAQPASDIGEFSKLGGATSSTKWDVVRATTIVKLGYCPGESSLADIEEAEGVTLFIDE